MVESTRSIEYPDRFPGTIEIWQFKSTTTIIISNIWIPPAIYMQAI